MISDCLGKPGYLFGHNAVLPKPNLFNGQNAIVAVNVHLGYNQVDSLVMKCASLERGMFRSEHIRSYKAKVDNRELTDKREVRRIWDRSQCKAETHGKGHSPESGIVI
ncbi:DNA-DIRECTED RNA polymerase I SUBUNIT 2 [Salix purpurea]|uniref:DNA-directed RNA polymerase n=2 Tax=Salix purpurea TaxID=77065 RepID=A0A9Q0WGZ8_SALPP|nr:DNA-DIRECTED RNA polymerase I SUBUNIT 2 [Salix purpurea]